MPPQGKKGGSTLLKATSTSDGRRGGALAQRALTAPREMRAEDLLGVAKAAAPAPKRGRENDAPAAVRWLRACRAAATLHPGRGALPPAPPSRRPRPQAHPTRPCHTTAPPSSFLRCAAHHQGRQDF